MATTKKFQDVVFTPVDLPPEPERKWRSQAFGYSVVRPIGRFSRGNLFTRPAKFEVVTPPRHLSSPDFVKDNIARYNTQAKAHGWDRWAIAVVDKEQLAVEARVEAINAKLRGASIRVRRHQYPDPETHTWVYDANKFELSVDLRATTVMDDARELRERAIDALRKQLADLEAPAKKTKRAQEVAQ